MKLNQIFKITFFSVFTLCSIIGCQDNISTNEKDSILTTRQDYTPDLIATNKEDSILTTKQDYTPDLIAINKKDSILTTRQDYIPGFEFWPLCEPLKICIEPGCTEFKDLGMKDKIYDAVDILNAIPETSLQFEIIDCDDNPDIKITCLNAIPICVAGTSDPFVKPALIRLTDGGLVAELSTCCPELLLSPPSAAEIACQRQGTALHELLHVVGFDHNGKGEHILGTDIIDDNSIINVYESASEFCEKIFTICTLSEGDINAIQILYPPATICDCFDDCNSIEIEIQGNDNLCVDEQREYCIPKERYCDVIWFGHPDINESTDRCVTLSYDAVGSDFIYADVRIRNCTYLSVNKKINVGPTIIMNNLTVVIDPCLDIISIDGGNPNYTYNWSSFNFSYKASPHISENNNVVRVRTPLKTGEEFCFRAQVTNECGTSYLPCEVCYTIPECRRSQKPSPSRANNACYLDRQCPDGFSCQDGICCEKTILQTTCVNNRDCPLGQHCIDGSCELVLGEKCKSNRDCGIGFTCNNGICTRVVDDECIRNSDCPLGEICKGGRCLSVLKKE